MARARQPVSIKLHPALIPSIKHETDSRSHHTDSHYYHFAWEDCPSMLDLIASKYAEAGIPHKYGFAVGEMGAGPCIMVPRD